VSGMGLFSRTALPALRKVMDLSVWKQRTYATNLANAGAADYRRQDVKFSDELRSARGRSLNLDVTHPSHLGPNNGSRAGVEVYEVPHEEGGAGSR